MTMDSLFKAEAERRRDECARIKAKLDCLLTESRPAGAGTKWVDEQKEKIEATMKEFTAATKRFTAIIAAGKSETGVASNQDNDY